MDINNYTNEQKLIEITNKNEKEKNKEGEPYSNKINDNENNTTNGDDSIYTIEELISYCSSPKSGLVSIIKTKPNNGTFINIDPEISNITNTITLKVAMIKKEISFSESKSSNDREINRVQTHHKKEKKYDNDNSIYIPNKTYSSKEPINDKDKKDKMKSFFKKKTKRIKDHQNSQNIQNNEEMNCSHKNIKNKISKGKKKKTRKSQDKIEICKNMEHSKSTNNIEREKEKGIKKSRKRTKESKNDDLHKIVKKKNDIGQDKDKEKEEKDLDEGKSPKIIIFDFSTSGKDDDNDNESVKEELKINISNNKKKSNNKLKEEEKKHHGNNSTKNSGNILPNFNKVSDNDFFQKRNKTINENDNSIIQHNKEKDKDRDKDNKSVLCERKFITPKSKNSCFQAKNTYKISQNKLGHNNSRKLSFNYGTKCIIKTKSVMRIDDNKKKKDKKRKHTEDFFNICASKNFQHNEEYHSKAMNTTTVKDNHKKSNKKVKNAVSITNSTCNTYNNNHNNSINNNNKDSHSRKDSNKSCHNTPNKKFRHLISHNYDKKNNNIEKKLNTNNKIAESSSLTNTPKNLRPKKSVYSSNKNLTNIKISSMAVENKDIHLEMNGKQETIINYTNQEMVDDENEYMLECFKVLLKLDKSKMPRCKSKVNFNFENNPAEKNKKKIALFDLDETLVHCTKDQKGLNGDSVNIKLPTNKIVNVGLNIRPHWKEALDLIKSHYHIVVYTASHQSYADAVLDYLDKENKYFQYRLYRNHCVQCHVNEITFYVKDLDTLNEKYNLKDVVLIDNSVLSFAYHLNNGIPIVPYIEQKEDSQLIMLAYYLLSIANFDDLTEENKKHINIEHFILQVKNLDNEEEEEIEDPSDGDEKNNDSKKDNIIIIDNKGDEKNTNDNNNDNCDNTDKDNNNNKIQTQKQDSLDNKKVKKILCKTSKKGLKIANDMKKNMDVVYNKNNKNYN